MYMENTTWYHYKLTSTQYCIFTQYYKHVVGLTCRGNGISDTVEPELTVTCISQISDLYRSARKVSIHYRITAQAGHQCITARKYCPKGDRCIQVPLNDNQSSYLGIIVGPLYSWSNLGVSCTPSLASHNHINRFNDQWPLPNGVLYLLPTNFQFWFKKKNAIQNNETLVLYVWVNCICSIVNKYGSQRQVREVNPPPHCCYDLSYTVRVYLEWTGYKHI